MVVFIGGANGQEDQECFTDPKARAQSICAGVCGKARAASHPGVGQRETDPQEKARRWENTARQRQLAVATITARRPPPPLWSHAIRSARRGGSRTFVEHCHELQRNPQNTNSTAKRDNPMNTACRRPLCGGCANRKISAEPTTFRAKPAIAASYSALMLSLIDRNAPADHWNATDSASVAM